jgi:hypothetical protein
MDPDPDVYRTVFEFLKNHTILSSKAARELVEVPYVLG